MQKRETAPRRSPAPPSSSLAASPASSSPGLAAALGAPAASAAWLLVSALVLVACAAGGDRTSIVDPPPDASFDAGAPLDAGAPVDAGASFDAEAPVDAGADAGAPPREEPAWRTYGAGLELVRATYSCGPEAWFAGSRSVGHLEGDSVALVLAEVFDDVGVYDLFGRGCDDVWAVGTDRALNRGVVVHYDGVTWSRVEVPELRDRRPEFITGNATHVWISGYQPGSRAFLFEHDGSAWLERAVPETAQRQLLGATDDGRLYMEASLAVGGVIELDFADGGRPTVIELVPHHAVVASAVVSGQLWVGLNRRGGLARLGASGWERFATPDEPAAIAAAEGGGVVVAGKEGSVGFFGGTRADPVPLPDGCLGGWGVWMHEGRLYVGALHGLGALYELEAPFDAGVWRMVDRDYGDVPLTGDRNTDLTLADGHIFFSAQGLQVFDLSGPASAGFETDLPPSRPSSYLVDHWVLTDGTRVVVDRYSATFARAPGGAWTEILLDGITGVKAMWGDASDRLYFSLHDADHDGRILEGALGTLAGAAPVAVGEGHHTAGHAVGDEVFAVGSTLGRFGRGSVLVRRDGAWAPLADPVVEAASETALWHDVHGSTESLWIVGSGILERTPTGWEERPLPPGAPLINRVFVVAPTDVWVGGPHGVHHWDGTGWQALELPSAMNELASSGALYVRGVVSAGGRLFIANGNTVWSHRLDHAVLE